MTLQRAWASALIANLAPKYGYLNKPPMILTTLATDAQDKHSASILSGKYNPGQGAVLGPERDKKQATSLTGGSGKTFSRVSGTADSNYYMPVINCQSILCADGTAGGGYTLLANDLTDGIEPCTIYVMAGPVPPGVTVTPATCYKSIELCAGQARNIRILFSVDSQVQVQFNYGSGWANVGVEKGSRNTDVHFANSDVVAIYVRPIPKIGSITIETSLGNVWNIIPPDTSFTDAHPKSEWLPSTGCVRFSGLNGWAAFSYQPVRGGQLSVTRIHDLKYEHPNAGSAWLSNGMLSNQDGQSWNNAVTTDGTKIKWSSQGTLADAGDGLGSFEPIRWCGTQLCIAPDFTDSVPGGLETLDEVLLRLTGVTIDHSLDDNRRMFGSSISDLLVNNDNNVYSPTAANLSLVVATSNDNGATAEKHGEYVVGIGPDGFTLANPSAGVNNLQAVAVDRMVFLGGSSDEPVTSGVEIVQDGWAYWSAIRFWAHRGGIRDSYLTQLPDNLSPGGIYIPPSAPGTFAPYGRAGDDYSGSWPILPEGTGDKPAVVFPATTSPVAALQALVSDLSDVVIDPFTLMPVRLAPYYMGFDKDSNLIIQAFDPDSQNAVYGFTDRVDLAEGAYPAVSWFPFASNLEVSNSICNLRGELTLAGQDWITNELLIEHRDNGPFVKDAIGYNRSCYIQSERWGTQRYLSTVADGLQVLTSQNTMIAKAMLAHYPFLRMGQSIMIWHPAAGLVPKKFYLTRVRHRCYDGAAPILDTYIVARACNGT